MKISKLELTLKIFALGTYTLMVAPHSIYKMTSLCILCGLGEILIKLVPVFVLFCFSWGIQQEDAGQREKVGEEKMLWHTQSSQLESQSLQAVGC